MISIAKAIKALSPDAEFVSNNDGVIEWLSADIAQPTNEAILAKQAELQAEYDAAQYQRDRALAYPSIQEQLDMQYWDSVNGTTTWADAIAQVKADYPKGAE
jgi:hypothetical protein